jgi:ubiquinone/menaquinone biosynthesis C-methylase UbiE
MWQADWTSSRSAIPRSATSSIDDAAYVGAIPEHYHDGVGPFLFEPFARYTAERIRALAPACTLETACGTGIVTRRLREALAAGALLVATDLHPPMMNIARATMSGADRVEWAQADMCSLHFADHQFDALVCQFGLMFVDDKSAAVREARRVLRPSGRLLLTTWAPLERNPIVGVAHYTLAEMFPEDPPRYLRRAPFGFGDPEALAELLIDAGFSEVEVDLVERAATSPSAHELAVGLVEGHPLVDEIKLRDPSRLPAAIDAVTRAIARQFGDSPVKSRITAVVASAIA